MITNASHISSTSLYNSSADVKLKKAVIAALVTLILGIGGFITWAAYAPLDKGVTTQAVVSLATKRKPVQSQFAGVVSQVLVQEGQTVAENEVVIRLNDVTEKTSLQIEQENLQAKKSLIAGSVEQLKNVNIKQNIVNNLLSKIKDLVSRGYIPLTKQLELESQLADIANMTVAIKTTIAQTLREEAVSAAKIAVLTQQLSHTELKAPTSGQVVGLTVQSVGAVVRAAERLMDIVPLQEPLILEAYIPSSDINRVSDVQGVDIYFHTFADAPTLVVEGKVESISKDLAVISPPHTNDDPANSMNRSPFYLARVSVTPAGRSQLGTRKVLPGMPASIVFKSGRQSLLMYLVQPLIGRVLTSMKEP